MIIAYIYLITLLIAPQLWLEPFVGIPVDYVFIPIWFIVLFLTGRLNAKLINQDKFLLLFIFWMAISMLVGGRISAPGSCMGLMIADYFRYLILYYLVAHTVSTTRRIKMFMIAFVIMALMLSVEGIQHWMTGVGWAGQALGWIDPDALAGGAKGRTRWVGIFDGPGVFAVIYTVALPFLLAGIKRSFPFFVRVASIVALPLLFLAIYLNGSRGGFIATLAVLVMHFGYKYKMSKVGLVIGIIVAISLFLLAPAYITDLNDASRSSINRIAMWSEGIEMVKQNPIFGIGRGGFQQYTGRLIGHNSGIELMGETGLIGLFAWVGFIYFSLKNLTVSIKNDSSGSDRGLLIALFIAIVGYLTSAMFVTLEYETFYVLLALAGAGARNQLSEQKSLIEMSDVKVIGAASAAFVLLIYLGINIFKVSYL